MRKGEVEQETLETKQARNLKASTFTRMKKERAIAPSTLPFFSVTTFLALVDIILLLLHEPTGS